MKICLVVPCGQMDGGTDGEIDGRTKKGTDRYDEANSRLSQFCESA